MLYKADRFRVADDTDQKSMIGTLTTCQTQEDNHFRCRFVAELQNVPEVLSYLHCAVVQFVERDIHQVTVIVRITDGGLLSTVTSRSTDDTLPAPSSASARMTWGPSASPVVSHVAL